MEIQTRVVLAELWLRDDLENIYALLFRFLGFGFRLAMSNVGWHVTQKFVILVPDPIAFAPRPALLDPGEPCDICQYTSFRPLFAGLLVTPRNKDDMGDGVPTDQLSHNHCDCTDSHCNSHIVLSACLCFFLSHLLSQVHRRQKQLSDFVEKKKYWTLPKSCGSQVPGQTLRRVLLGSRVQFRTCQSGLKHIGAPTAAALIRAHSRTERRQPATSNCWLALHRLERGGAA